MLSIFPIEKKVIARARTSRLSAHYSIAEDKILTLTVTFAFDLAAQTGRIEVEPVATMTQTISLCF